MIAFDTNILVHAHRRSSPWHATAHRRLSEAAQGAAQWAIPWSCLHEFIGVVTHPRVLVPPSTLAEASKQIDAWRESPRLVLLSEAPGHWETLERLLKTGRIVGPKVHDARIAAICLDNGVSELWSADRDFSRFPALKVRNPLVSST